MPTPTNPLQIVVFRKGTMHFADTPPERPPEDGFIWVFLDRTVFDAQLPQLQQIAQKLGGSALLDLHVQDLRSPIHPSDYDYTSVYELIVFRRLATDAEAEEDAQAKQRSGTRGVFSHISTRGVGFAIFDRLLISVHPAGCFTARTFIDRYLSDAVQNEDVAADVAATARSRLPFSAADLMLRMTNLMVDSYLELRKKLSSQIEAWQQELLQPRSRFSSWTALMAVRNELHTLEDLCEEQQDAMLEWLEALRAAPLGHGESQGERDALIARSRDVIEHIERVVRHARRMEESAETVVQIHFNAQSNRTNDIMRTLTALTAVFLPLNLITGFFGMNFDFLPLVHRQRGLWWAIALMVLIAVVLVMVFRRKRYLERGGR